jgi:hypothetical protein
MEGSIIGLPPVPAKYAKVVKDLEGIGEGGQNVEQPKGRIAQHQEAQREREANITRDPKLPPEAMIFESADTITSPAPMKLDEVVITGQEPKRIELDEVVIEGCVESYGYDGQTSYKINECK